MKNNTTIKYSEDGLFMLVRPGEIVSYDEIFCDWSSSDYREHGEMTCRKIEKLQNHILSKISIACLTGDTLPKAFWVPLYRPKFNEDMTGICFARSHDNKTNVNRTIEWWNEAAKRITKQESGRIGNLNEFLFFMCFEVKRKLKEERKTSKEAWISVFSEQQSRVSLSHDRFEGWSIRMAWDNELSNEFPWFVFEDDGTEPQLFNYKPQADAVRTIYDQTKQFIKVEGEFLSLEDEYLKHKPETAKQKKLKNHILKVLKDKRNKNFWKSICDPSIRYGNLVMGLGIEPGCQISFGEWYKLARNNFEYPKMRVGTFSEKITFHAVLIKKMVAAGWTAKDAWYAVCDNSVGVGHYRNEENVRLAKEQDCFNYRTMRAHHKRYLFKNMPPQNPPQFTPREDWREPTGQMPICGFYDLGNQRKYVAKDDNPESGGFYIFGGNWLYDMGYAISDYEVKDERLRETVFVDTVAFIVSD